ncbi:MAG: hypothetical protein K8T89_02785 [Planctomycetes bacterium]|nr:hypothetical protein [Planctomycetota bacterium]
MQANQRSKGPIVTIDCPVCHEQEVEAKTYNMLQRDGIISNFTSWVVCPECRSHLLSSRDVNELPNLSREELQETISEYFPLVNRAFAVLSLLLGLIPFLGLAIGVLAVLLNRRPSRWHRLSRIGFIIGALSAIGFGILIAIQKK